MISLTSCVTSLWDKEGNGVAVGTGIDVAVGTGIGVAARGTFGGVGATVVAEVAVELGNEAGVGSGSLMVRAKMDRLSTCTIAVDLPKSTSVTSCAQAPSR